MRVLICGCGYVGAALGLLLAAEGHEAFGLRRNPSRLPPEIRPVAADLSRPLPPETLPPNLDAAVYAASPSDSSDAAYRAAYTDGPRNLLAALQNQANVRRLLFVSSTGVYGQKNGEWVDEDSPAEPASASGKRLLEGEGVALDGPIPAVVLRLGGIYGPGRAGMISRALRQPPPEEPPRYTNRIHRDDCAGTLRHLLTLPDPEPVYLGVDSDPADRLTVAEWLADHMGRVRDRREDAVPTDTSDAARARTNKRCSNRRLLASGYNFRYPTFREGFAALLADHDIPA